MNPIKEEYLKGNPHVRRFKSIRYFLDFCMRYRINTSNSETYYDEDEDRNYLISDKITASME